jgi:hypothetical protein
LATLEAVATLTPARRATSRKVDMFTSYVTSFYV